MAHSARTHWALGALRKGRVATVHTCSQNARLKALNVYVTKYSVISR